MSLYNCQNPKGNTKKYYRKVWKYLWNLYFSKIQIYFYNILNIILMFNICYMHVVWNQYEVELFKISTAFNKIKLSKHKQGRCSGVTVILTACSLLINQIYIESFMTPHLHLCSLAWCVCLWMETEVLKLESPVSFTVNESVKVFLRLRDMCRPHRGERARGKNITFK